jgi:hypothetical protein
MSSARFAWAAAALAVVLGLSAVVAFGLRDEDGQESSAGPEFVVECTWSHRAADDPIVHPGHAGASHVHDFFGNVTTNASSRAPAMLAESTSCQTPRDTAAYWLPTLYDGDDAVEPGRLFAYYRRPAGVDPATIETYPLGLAMVAGDVSSSRPQSPDVVRWFCGAPSAGTAEPVSCPRGAPLTLRVVFPACWDGTNLDSDDHRGHVSHARGGGCPATHPVPLPELVIDVAYRFSGDPSSLRLASGPLTGAHADFLNAWDAQALADHVERCLRRGVDCGVPATRAFA